MIKKNASGRGDAHPSDAQAEEEDEDDEEEDEQDEKQASNKTTSSSSSSQPPIPTDRPKGTRPATPADGLLSVPELQTLARHILAHNPLSSAYGSSDWLGGPADQASRKEKQALGLTYQGRGGEGEDGANEPGWTSFTPLWRLTLDYLFDIPFTPSSPSGAVEGSLDGGERGSTGGDDDGKQASVRVEPRRVLLPHKTADMEPGLPKKGVCASDHTLLSVEYALID